MATVILGAIGAGVGSILGGPGGARLGWSIGTAIGGAVDASRVRYPAQESGKLSDLKVSTSSYGTFIPWVWGRGRVPVQIMWATDLVEHQSKTTVGGKGGPKQTTITDTYTVSLAGLICMGGRMNPQSLKRIHLDDTVAFDSSQDPKLNKVTPRFYLGTYTQSADPLLTAQYGSDAPAFRGRCYMVLENLLLTDYGNRIPNISVEIETDPVYLSDVVTDLASEVSVPGQYLNLLDGEGPDSSRRITGLQILDRGSVLDTLQPLLSALQTDLIDVDGVLRLVRRGKPVVATIHRDEQGASKVDSGFAPPQDRMTEKRTQTSDLPRSIDYTYYSLSNGLQQANQTVVRQAVRNDNVITISSSLIQSDDDARKTAEQELYLPWLERYVYTTTLLATHSDLCVSDPIFVEVDDEGTIERLRITDCECALPGTVTLSMVRDDATIEERTVVGSSPEGGLTPSIPVPSTFFAWSGKEIRDSDTTQPGFYVLASGPAGWRGCTVYYSADGGSTWVSAGVCSARGTFGSAQSALAPPATPSSSGFDTTSSVKFHPALPSEVDTTSEQSVSNGTGNYGLVLGANSYELIGFASSAPLSGGDYSLSDMLRAQRGTSGAGHAAGDNIVVLDSSVIRIPVSPNLIGKQIMVKCVSPYVDLEDVTAQTVTIAQPSYLYPTSEQVLNSIPSVPYWIHRGAYIANNPDAYGGTGPDTSLFPPTDLFIRRYADGPSGGYVHTYPYGASWVQMQVKNSNSSPENSTSRFIVGDGADALRGVIEVRIALAGSISASGTSVVGTGTDFTVFSAGDYLCTQSQGVTRQCCEILSVQDSTHMTLKESTAGFTSAGFFRGYKVWDGDDSNDQSIDITINLPPSEMFVLHVFHYRNSGDHDDFFYVITDLLDSEGVSFAEPEYYKSS